MGKENLIALLFIVSVVSAASIQKTAKNSSAEDTNFQPSKIQSIQVKNAEANNGQQLTTAQQPEVENTGYARGRVFEYSFSTSHSDPKSGKDSDVASGTNLPVFNDHVMARQSLPRFLNSYGDLPSDVGNESKNTFAFTQSFVPKVFSRAPDDGNVNGKTDLLNVEKMIPEASYSFKYSPPPMPSLMKMSFADEDDDEFGSDGFYQPEKQKPVAKKTHRSAPTVADPRVKMVTQVMGNRNENGKPYGKKTTMVYRDPKNSENFMQVTEVQMNMNRNNGEPEKEEDQERKTVSSSRTNFKRGSDTRPVLRYVDRDFLDEGSEPEEPIF